MRSSETSSEEENDQLLENNVNQGDEVNKGISTIRGITLAVCLGSLILLQACNISMLTTVSSSIARDLDAYSNVSWFSSSYLIATSSMTPVGGRLCKIFSSVACLLFSCIFMSLGSIITAFAPSFAWFLVGRVVSGIGAAFVFGVATIFVIELVSDKRRGLFIGLVNSGYTVGVASGAVIAGALEARLGWRSVFWLQIPLALPAGLGIYFFAPQTRSDKENSEQSFITALKRVDYFGVATMIAFLVLLLYSFTTTKINYWTLLSSAVLLVAFVTIEAKVAKEPIIPIEVMKSRPIALTCMGTVAYMMSRWTVLFYTPVYSIAVRGWAPATAGMILIPTNAGFATGGLAAGIFHIRKAQSYYVTTLVVFLLFSGSMFVFSKISTTDPIPWLYLLVTFINGFLTGAALNYSYAHLLHISKPKLHAIVTSLNAMFRGFAGSFGSAIGGGIFGRALQSNLEMGFEGQDFDGKDELIRKLLGSPVLAGSLHGEQRAVAQDSYAAATSTLFFSACFLALIATVFQAGTGTSAAEDADEDDEVQPLLPNQE